MSNKVERLAAMTDDKTLISTLIRECSDRIKLIEFKDARADIWQYFRLVQLDGHTLSYAVCVRCMKPVSYKAREGTGGLHRHPCSKALHAAAIVADLSSSQSNHSSSNHKGTPITAASQSSGSHSTHHLHEASSGRNSSSNFRNMLNSMPSSSSAVAANLSMNSLLTANLAPNFPFNFPEIKFEQSLSLSSPERDDDVPALKLVEICMKELIPWEVTNNTLHSFVNEVWHADQGYVGDSQSLDPLLDILYKKGLLKVRDEMSLLDFVPIVVDIWEANPAHRLATLSVSLEHKKQVIKTIDISLVDTFKELKEELDSVRSMFCEPQQIHVYIFDNSYQSHVKQQDDNELYICPLHELDSTIDEAFLNCDQFPLVKALHKVQRYCAKQANFLSEIVNLRPNSWRERLTLFKMIIDNADIVKEVLGNDKDINSTLNKEIWNFLSPFHDALLAYTTEPTLNVVTLWKAKLDDHCKARDCDSSILSALKERFRKPCEKRSLTPMGLMAVCLDPRFKRLKMLTSEWREATYSKLRETINQADGEKEVPEPMAEPETTSSNGEPNLKRQKTSELLNSFNEYMDDSKEAVKDELDKYLELDLGQPSDLEPFDFWSGEHGARYPRLAAIARQLLSTPIVPSTCQLLPAGKLLSTRRLSVVGKHLDEILFLNSLFST